MFEIAAEHGDGVGDLLDEVIKPPGRSARRTPSAAEPEETAVAIVGRPNVGKSSLVNRLLREERMMVSEMPGTTRDSVDSMLHWHKRSSASSTLPASGGRQGRASRTRSKW